jgi:hypothetical protein
MSAVPARPRLPARQEPPALAIGLAIVALVVTACAGVTSPSSTGPAGSPGASPAASSLPAGGRIATAADAFAAVQSRSPWFDGIMAKDPQLIGQAAWWEATAAADGGWAVTVDVGWGDCQAGCIDHHTWRFAVAADGSVAFVSEAGAPVPDDQRASLAAAAAASGVGGQVTAGPTCPVERPGDPACVARPVANAVLVVTGADDSEVARFTTDASGLFRIALPAGSYTLTPQPVAGLMGTPAPEPFTVSAGRLTVVALGYDTGIR